MKQDRCIFCMETIEEKSSICPHCGKGIWQYRWQQGWYQPMTVLQERYYLGTVIGQGAFGVTYLAWDEAEGRKAAVKIYSAEHDLSAFEREAEILKEHKAVPGLVELYDSFEENGQGCLVMEYLSGGTLKDYLAKQPEKRMDSSDSLTMLLPIMEALVHMHAEGIVHCDISTDNIMFDQNGQCRLIDLGAARRTENENAQRLLKEAYGAPEQYANPDKIGPWTDVYCFCALLYELVTGNRIPPAASRVRKDTLQPPSAFVKISAHVEAAILRGLEMEIQKRYFNMQMLMEQLGQNIENIQFLESALRHQWGQLWVSISAQGKFSGSASGKARSKKRLKAAAAVLVGAAVIAGIGFGINSWYWKQNPEKYFAKKMDDARKTIKRDEDKKMILPDVAEHENILHTLKENGMEKDYSTEDYQVFELEESELGKLDLKYNNGYKMFLEWDVIRDEIFYYMDFNEKNVTQEKRTYNSNIVYRKEGSGEIVNKSSVEMRYTYEPIMKNDLDDNIELLEYITIKFDPVDERVISVTFNTNDKQRGVLFLEKMISNCCPETYLTADEAEEILTDTANNEDYPTIGLNECAWLHTFTVGSDDDLRYYMSIAASNDGLL